MFLMGLVQNSPFSSTINSFYVSVLETHGTNLRQFWEMEEVPSITHVSFDDTIAENIKKTTIRLTFGRFMVTILFRTPRPILEDSKVVAIQRFKVIESQHVRYKDLYQQYV